MKKRWFIALVALLVVLVASAYFFSRQGNLERALIKGVSFGRGGNWPEVVKTTNGFSEPEEWGRWTDGGRAILEFNEDLPKRMKLRITARVFGANGKQPITVTAGGVKREVVFDGFEIDERLVEFDGVHGKSVQFDIPSSIPANEVVPGSKDTRRLGLGLVRLGVDD